MKSLNIKNTAAKVGGVACALTGSSIALASSGVCIIYAGLSAGIGCILDEVVNAGSKLAEFGVELMDKEFED